MTSFLNLAQAQAEANDTAPENPTGANDFEIVVGRAQIASWLFVGIVIVAICSSLAYLAGEAITAKKTARTAASPAPAPAAAVTQLPQASIIAPPNAELSATAKTSAKPAAPLNAEPEMGKVYLQIAAVERGMAMLLAQGLRSHGFDSFVAPGPNDKIFRVLIGPLPDPQAFRQAMTAVSALDLAMFARKYEK